MIALFKKTRNHAGVLESFAEDQEAAMAAVGVAVRRLLESGTPVRRQLAMVCPVGDQHAWAAGPSDEMMKQLANLGMPRAQIRSLRKRSKAHREHMTLLIKDPLQARWYLAWLKPKSGKWLGGAAGSELDCKAEPL